VKGYVNTLNQKKTRKVWNRVFLKKEDCMMNLYGHCHHGVNYDSWKRNHHVPECKEVCEYFVREEDLE